MDESMLSVLHHAARSAHPQVQLAAINMLMQLGDARAGEVIQEALSSNYWPVRIQAAYALTYLQHPTARSHIDALLAKAPPQAHPLLISLLPRLGDPQTAHKTRQAIHSVNRDIQRAAILSSAQLGRDDMLADIRLAASHCHPLEQEACAMALGWMEDAHSMERLQDWAQNGPDTVQVASLQALWQLGSADAAAELEDLARGGLPYAIYALKDVPSSAGTLAELCQNPDLSTRAHAAIALLELRDERCLPVIAELLLPGPRDITVLPHHSPAGALRAWRVITSSQQNLAQEPHLYESGLQMRERILQACSHLEEGCFLALAERLLEQPDPHLLPVLIHQLEQLSHPRALNLLRRYAQQPGRPLLRGYCRLALLRLRDPGPWRQSLQQWALREAGQALIEFRPILPWEAYSTSHDSSLTATERARLLVEVFETLAMERDEQALHTLLEAIESGHPGNRFVLAGILLRASS
jgi:HEAT repeat protein